MMLKIVVYFLFFSFCVLGVAKELTAEEKLKVAEAMVGPRPEMKPKEGYVPTAKVAIALTEIIVGPIIGNKLENERPLTAKRDGDKWIVEGRKRQQHCKRPDKNCFESGGSPLYLEMSVDDARIIKATHYH